MKISLFGMLADAAKQSVIEIESVNDTDSLLNKVKEMNSTFRDAKFVIAVNKKVVSGNQVLNENDEVALLPPFAGG
ncbi:MAG: MoaD/ThiS family protein [Bacteroidia bacterium]